MRKLISILLLIPLLGMQRIPGPGGKIPGGATNVVSSSANGCSAGSGTTTIACTTTGNVATNGTALVDLQWFCALAPTVSSVTASSGTFSAGGTNAWYAAGNGNDANGFIVGATAGAQLTVTYHLSGTLAACFPDMNVDLSQGTVSAPALDGSLVAAAIGSAATATSNNVTTSQNNEFLWAICGGSGTISAGTSPQAMTQSQPSGANSTITMYGIAVTAGSTNNATCTQAGTGFYIIQVFPMH